MKLGLEVVATVSSIRMDTEGQDINHIINKLIGKPIIMPRTGLYISQIHSRACIVILILPWIVHILFILSPNSLIKQLARNMHKIPCK